MTEEQKKKGTIDKVLMGAIIGGAIGSVLGATIAPKKGEETRQDIKDAAKKAKNSSVKIFSRIKNWFKRKSPDQKNNGTEQK